MGNRAMIRQHRVVLVSIVLLGVLALGSAPTAADPGSTPSPRSASPQVVGHARIEGDVTVRVLRTVSNNPTQPPGTVCFRTYRFVPQCNAGGCRTILYRPRGDDFTRFVLAPRRSASGERVYRGTARPSADCVDGNSGQVLVEDGFTTVERIVVHTPRVNASNVATKITGELQVNSTPTAAGAAAGCTPGHFVSTFRSVGPFTT